MDKENTHTSKNSCPNYTWQSPRDRLSVPNSSHKEEGRRSQPGLIEDGRKMVLLIVNEKNPLFTLITLQLFAVAKINILNVEGNLILATIALGKKIFSSPINWKKAGDRNDSPVQIHHHTLPQSRALRVNIRAVNHFLHPDLAYWFLYVTTHLNGNQFRAVQQILGNSSYPTLLHSTKLKIEWQRYVG